MLRFALLRILGAIPTLFVVIAVAFMLIHAAPGGPFDSERVLLPEVEQSILRAYHLDEPLPQQFARYLQGIMRGDFGPSNALFYSGQQDPPRVTRSSARLILRRQKPGCLKSTRLFRSIFMSANTLSAAVLSAGKTMCSIIITVSISA